MCEGVNFVPESISVYLRERISVFQLLLLPFKDLKVLVISLSKRSNCEIVTLMILSDDFKVVYRWLTVDFTDLKCLYTVASQNGLLPFF